MDSEIPRRIVYCSLEYQSLFKELRYAILDLGSNKFENGISSKYISSSWQSNEVSDDDYLLHINSLRHVCQSIWDSCDTLILKKSKGIQTSNLLANMDEEERKLIEQVLEWVNPTFASSDLMLINEGQVNW